jgi:hypothetical protein
MSDLSLPSTDGGFKHRRVKFDFQKLKIENLRGYFQDETIDLAPRFQRGRVWGRKDRQGLIKNILQGKPVPAIFLYKTPSGSRNNFIILDGKQRLESILLYIGNQRQDFKITNWISYIFGDDRKEHGFKAPIGGKKKSLKELSDEEIVKFRDYSLLVIEIEFDDDTTLQEIVELFVDINQTGVKVTRFEIVKSLYRDDPLLNQVLGLIALAQKRGKDIYYKIKSTPFTQVLRQLDVVSHVGDRQAQVDIMRERLFEYALFSQTGAHRKPSQILKDYISQKQSAIKPILNKDQLRLLTNVFKFLKECGKNKKFHDTRLATEQTHFYVLITFLMDETRNIRPENVDSFFTPGLTKKLIALDSLLAEKTRAQNTTISEKVKDYALLSAKQTTDAAKRQQRQKLFKELLEVA